VPPKLGVENARTAEMASGRAPVRMYGLNLPHRVLVRSAAMPMTTSNSASKNLETPIMIPAATAAKPNTSV